MENQFEQNRLRAFVNFIQSQDVKTQKSIENLYEIVDVGNKRLLELSIVALVVGPTPIFRSSLVGKELLVQGTAKRLNNNQLISLYEFIRTTNESGDFLYTSSFSDIKICDGSTFTLSVEWADLKIFTTGGNSTPNGINKLIDFCKEIIEK